jgi:hypothetical protein
MVVEGLDAQVVEWTTILMNLYSRGAHGVGRERLPWARTSRGAWTGGAHALWGTSGSGARMAVGARTAEGAHGGRARATEGGTRPRGDHGNGARPAKGHIRARPPLEARTGRAQPWATWLAGAQIYVPSSGGVHVSSEEGIN